MAEDDVWNMFLKLKSVVVFLKILIIVMISQYMYDHGRTVFYQTVFFKWSDKTRLVQRMWNSQYCSIENGSNNSNMSDDTRWNIYQPYPVGKGTQQSALNLWRT